MEASLTDQVGKKASTLIGSCAAIIVVSIIGVLIFAIIEMTVQKNLISGI